MGKAKYFTLFLLLMSVVVFTLSVRKLMHVDNHESEFRKYLSIESAGFKETIKDINDVNFYKTIFLTRIYHKDSLLYHNDILDESEVYELYHVESYKLGKYTVKLYLLHSPGKGFVNSSGIPIILNDYKYHRKKNDRQLSKGWRINKVHIYNAWFRLFAYLSFVFILFSGLRYLPKLVKKYITDSPLIDIATVFILWSLIRFGMDELNLLYSIDARFKTFLFLISDIISLYFLVFQVKMIPWVTQMLRSSSLTLSLAGTSFVYLSYLYIRHYIAILDYNFDINHALQLSGEHIVFMIFYMILSAVVFMGLNRYIDEDAKEVKLAQKLTQLFIFPLIAAIVFLFVLKKSVVVILSLFVLLAIFSFDLYRNIEEKRLTYYVWWIIFQAVLTSFIFYQPSKERSTSDFQKLINASFYTPDDADLSLVNQFKERINSSNLINTLFSVTEDQTPESSDIRKYIFEKSNLRSQNHIELESVNIFKNGKSLVKGAEYDYQTIRQHIRKRLELKKEIYYLPVSPHFILHFRGPERNDIYITLKHRWFDPPKFPYILTLDGRVIQRNNLSLLGITDGKLPNKVNENPVELKNGYQAIVYNAEKGFIGPISLFTLIFAFGVIGVLITIVLNQRFNFIYTEEKTLKFADRSSLSFRIQVAIVGLSIIIFTVIGIMTTIYLNRMSAQERAQKSRVSSDLLIKYINEELGNNEDINSIKNYLTEQAPRLGELFEGSIDIYDQRGYNLKSSRPSSEYAPNLPNPVLMNMSTALNKINQGKFSSYPVSDRYNIIQINTQNNANTLYLGYSPSILRYSNVEKEYVRTYIGTMLNVYIFLFLLATAIAITISNTVTNPLTILKNNLRTYKFGKTHPKLDWSSNDEIGELINEYNLLTDEITKSADLLAKTEREMAWREMAKQVAHEIKNPLTPMKLSLQYLERASKDDPEKAKVLIQKISNTLMEQINNLTQIADSFSNFATLPKTTNETIVLNEVVEAIHDLFRKREDMDIDMLEPVEDVRVLADRNHLVRILNNVVKNATQAIPETRRGKIEMELTKNEHKAIIRVSDNGTGISDEMRPKVFTPNFTSKSSGTGLGLAICANMLESMNGRIYFESTEGVGTDFYIELPLIKDEGLTPGQEVVVLEDE